METLGRRGKQKAVSRLSQLRVSGRDNVSPAFPVRELGFPVPMSGVERRNAQRFVFHPPARVS